MNNISDHVTLVELIDYLDNVNHALSVFENSIFHSYYKRDLQLSVEYLNLIYSCSVEEKLFALFETVFYAVIYINPKAKKLMPR